MESRIFVVLPRSRWPAALSAGELRTPALLEEGFIHAATREQLAGVLARHFAGQQELLLVEIDADALSSILRWTPSARDGECFPHVHGPVPMSAVVSIESILDSGHRQAGNPPQRKPDA